MRYDDTPTVVVVRVPIRGGLLMVRRALAGEGQGRLALPGGYQMSGETWQEAGAREVLEETGVAVEPAGLRLAGVETTPDRRQNLLFCDAPPAEHEGPFRSDAEMSEVAVIDVLIETAFPPHTAKVRDFFARRRSGPIPSPRAERGDPASMTPRPTAPAGWVASLRPR